jgi:heptosyltransferase III
MSCHAKHQDGNQPHGEEALAPRDILIVNVTRIGDTLVATPAIEALHRRWPMARITVLGGARRIEVLENLPSITHTASLSKDTAPWRGWLGGYRYDLALVYNYDLPLVRYALRVARRVVAFRQNDAAINVRLYRCVDPDLQPAVHITGHFLLLPAALGITETNGRVRYCCRATELAAARQRLIQCAFIERRPLIGLQIASFPTKSYRDWPVEHFLELCLRIRARWPQAAFLLFGGPDEKERTAWLATRLGSEASLLLAGRLSLRETAALMAQTDLYIGVDTGPTHLMSSFDIPIIGLYHPRHPSIGLGPKDHPLNFSLDHPRRDDLPDGEPRSMGDISVDRVFAQVEQALATRGLL